MGGKLPLSLSLPLATPRPVQIMAKIPWSAMLHVRPLPGRGHALERGSAGAYAVVLALATDEADYRKIVTAEMERIGLFVAELESLAPYEPHEDDPDNVRRCAAELSDDWFNITTSTTTLTTKPNGRNGSKAAIPFSCAERSIILDESRPPERKSGTVLGRDGRKDGSPGLIRTGGRPINSRMLYR